MKVIYSPETYFKLAKLDFLFPFNQFSQKSNQNEIALGGVYEAVVKENNFCQLLPGNFLISRYDLIPYDSNKYCFLEHDSVIFLPTCTENEIVYLLSTNKLRIGCKYIIKKVINYFYVILQDDQKGLSNPIRFSDIQLSQNSDDEMQKLNKEGLNSKQNNANNWEYFYEKIFE